MHLRLRRRELLRRCGHVGGIGAALQHRQLRVRSVHGGLRRGDLLRERRLERRERRERLVQLELRRADRRRIGGVCRLGCGEVALGDRHGVLGGRDVLGQRCRGRALQEGEVGLRLLDLGLRGADVGGRARGEHPVEPFLRDGRALLGEPQRLAACGGSPAEQHLEIRPGAPHVRPCGGDVGRVRPPGHLGQVGAGRADAACAAAISAAVGGMPFCGSL